MTRGFNVNRLTQVRNLGKRFMHGQRNIQAPSIPTGIHRSEGAQRHIYVKPRRSRRERDVNRYKNFKKQLLQRYDTNEYVRRENLTTTQHESHTGRIGSQGFRRYTTVKGVPYFRDQAPIKFRENLVRQYAAQNESEHSQKMLHSADQDVFRWKRDDGSRELSAYRFKKRQRFVSKVSGR